MGVRLAAFNLPSIAKLTMTDELHLQELGERKIALFCCIPDSDKSLNYLVGMIYTQLIQTLYRQADRVHKGRLACAGALPYGRVREHFLAERHLFVGVATMRSRAIFCSIIVQNMAQLKAMYKDDWESLVGLCDEFLYLGGTEKETHKYVSGTAGKRNHLHHQLQPKQRSQRQLQHQPPAIRARPYDPGRGAAAGQQQSAFCSSEGSARWWTTNTICSNTSEHPLHRGRRRSSYDYTAADNARDDLPGAPENYELLDMDDFLPAEAAEMKPTIQRIRRPK